MELVNVIPFIWIESHAMIPRLVIGVGSKVVIIVCEESQPKELVSITIVTPVSAGLQEGSIAKVESEGKRVVVII